MGYLFFPLIIGAMWFFMIRPQQQRLRNQRALVLSLEAGQEVITVGGLIGVITVVHDREVTLDLGNGIEVRVVRSAVSARLPSENVGPVEEN
ncbi:MAG: yajC [Acidimicrobiales bacterium]|jgi:preprotein translocase subunit YajC|nr:yajC [Acidimicrobiales bacterium]